MTDLIGRLRAFEGSDELGDGDFSLLTEAAAEIERLRAEVEALREALECMIIGACAVAVPHNGERAVLQDAVNIARAALAPYRNGGKQ